MTRVDEVKMYGANIGLDIVGVTSSEPFPEYIENVRERIEGGLIPSESQEEENIFKRVDFFAEPENSLPNAKSIMLLGMCYFIDDLVDGTQAGEPCGRIGRHLWRDFYGELWKKKDKLVSFLEGKGIRCSKEAHLPYKLVAKRAGVGNYGKNCLIHNQSFGSWIVLTSIVTDAPFDLDNPSSLECGSCEACVRACPTHAIVGDYTLNVGRCINHLLASTKPIPLELRPLIGNWINSCDRCQEVCPYNRNVAPIKKRFPNPRKKWTTSPALMPLLDISEDEFQKTFADLDWYKPDLKFLKRNITVALGNIGDPVSIPKLGKMLNDPEGMLRAHAAWAIERIGGIKSRELLQEALQREKDAEVKNEIEDALQSLS